MGTTIEIDSEVLRMLEREAKPFVETTPNAVLRRLLGIDSEGEEGSDGKEEVRTPGGRLKKGLLLPEDEYEVPLLRTLLELDGGAPMSTVLAALEPKLSNRLTKYDFITMKDGKTIRWHNRAQFVRLALVKQGDMKADSPRGIWEISDQGRKRVVSSSAA